MHYERLANDALTNLGDYLKGAETSFTLVVATYLATAAVYALLAIAQAVRELRP